MFNKHKKMYLLSGLFIFISTISMNVQEVYAKMETPKLTISESRGTPKLEWTTKLLEEDIIFKTGFEENDSSTINLTSYGTKNAELHSLSPLAAYSGNRGYLLNDNVGKGQYPADGNEHVLILKDRLYIPNGTKLTANFKAKSVGNSSIYLGGDGDLANEIRILDVKTVKDHAIGETKIYLDSTKGVRMDDYVTLSTDSTNYNYIYEIKDIDKQNNIITLDTGIEIPIANGDNFKQIAFVNPLYFFDSKLNNTDWTTYTVNDYVYDGHDYDSNVKGIELYFYVGTNGQLMIDDFELGYATEVEIFRDGQSVYRGYDLDFRDKSVKNILKPNNPTSVYGYYDENSQKIFLNIDKSKINTVETYYQIQSIGKDGSRSELSPKQFVTISSDVKNYKYAISNSSVAPDLINKSASSLFDISANGIDIENDFIHIQAIDSNGNVSEISTFKLSDIMGSTNNSSQYQQDVLLRLLKGDFALYVEDVVSFGPVRLTASKQTVTTRFNSNFAIVDARGTQQGWKLTVSATPFTEDTFDGFDGTPTQLPLGTLSLNSIQEGEQIANIDNVTYPEVTTSGMTVIDSGAITLAEAEKGEGMGQFSFNFGDEALSIVVDSSTAKIDDVNYPTGMTPYTSTITWDLVTGP